MASQAIAVRLTTLLSTRSSPLDRQRDAPQIACRQSVVFLTAGRHEFGLAGPGLHRNGLINRSELAAGVLRHPEWEITARHTSASRQLPARPPRARVLPVQGRRMQGAQGSKPLP